jgi:hypothetical protein
MTEEEKQALRVPMWCPVCDYVMKNGPGGDNKTYFKWGCCRHCHVEFIEDRESRWKSGWRPSAEDVAGFIKKLYGRG